MRSERAMRLWTFALAVPRTKLFSRHSQGQPSPVSRVVRDSKHPRGKPPSLAHLSLLLTVHTAEMTAGLSTPGPNR